MIKTFPIVMSLDFHDKVAKAATEERKTLKDFILDAINEKIEKSHVTNDENQKSLCHVTDKKSRDINNN